jgi:hypothetical protein
MKDFKLRLNPLSELLVYLIFGTLLLTAGVWLWAQSNLSTDNPMPSLMMKIHGAAAMAALVLLGALIHHIRRGWTAKKNRLSGVSCWRSFSFWSQPDTGFTTRATNSFAV